MSDARVTGRKAICESVPAEIWEANQAFSTQIKELIAEHPLTRHPLIGEMNDASLGESAMRAIHLEFRYAFTQSFVDALMHAMLGANELEARYGAMAKISARFVLNFNVLDELGFAGHGDGAEWHGDPANSHYMMFHKTLEELGVNESAAQAYQPCPAAVRARSFIESSFGDYVEIVTVLTVIETIFEAFAGPWSTNMRGATDVDVDGGYHSIHVDEEGTSVDDDHAEDLWYVFRQAVTPERYEDVRTKTNETLDVLLGFVNGIVELASAA